MAFLRLGIKGRLYAGFAALVVIGLALAAFAVTQLSAIQSQVGKMNALAANATRVLDISVDLQAIRRALLRYANDGDEPSFKESAEREQDAIKLLKDSANATLSEERKTIYHSVQGGVVKLGTVRETLGGDVKKMLASRAMLFSVGDELGAGTDKLVMAARGSGDRLLSAALKSLEPGILLVRVASWQFLATRDPKGVAAFKANADRAKTVITILDQAGLPANIQALLDGVKSALGRYQEAFAVTAESVLKSDELYRGEVGKLTVDNLDTLAPAEASLKLDFDATRTQTEETISSTIFTQTTVAAGSFVLGCLIAFFIARGIARPLNGMTGAMAKLADGNFDVVLPGLGQSDEIGQMAAAVEGFKLKAVERARLESERRSEEDRTAAARRKADMQKLADEFEAAVGEIVGTVSTASTELEAAATTLTKTAETTQKLSTSVASASTEASTSVQTVASATEEMASSIGEIGRQVQESSRIAGLAVDQARRTDDRITKLAQAASRIGDVTELITSIAEQTNLLALNATIEAARAGEAGKGFAVVAQEVKALAAQTAKATSEISGQIGEMQSATQESVAAIKEIGGTIGRISEISASIAVAVDEQGTATHEITRNVQQAAAGTTQVATSITNVNRGAAETGSASAQVLSSAQELANEGNRLKLEMDKFLATVRAA